MSINLMLDIETLGTKPNTKVLQIALALFDIDSGKVYNTYSVNLDIDSQKWRSYDKETVEWWKQQDANVIQSVFGGKKCSFPEAIRKIHRFVTENCDKDELTVWCNGLSFDMPIMKTCFEDCGLDVPWWYYNERDVRTLVSSFGIKVPPRLDKHDALADVLAQTKLIIDFFGAFK